jgi:hypothetical protein
MNSRPLAPFQASDCFAFTATSLKAGPQFLASNGSVGAPCGASASSAPLTASSSRRWSSLTVG